MRKKLSILIVEDDVVDVQIAEYMLKKVDQGININHCDNGEEAMSYLFDIKTTLPDLILLDINMPIMNGKEFLAYKAKVKDFQRIPVIMLSSSGFIAEKNECIKLGATDFIEKPLTVEAISASLKRFDFLVED